ncbi:tumor necrosis factor receptor superfamily member 5 [Stegastes partitus]|uniref:Tumor necrosis factor receptor superfamily member 5-like n=1 Tax=Stegastes partitus TaxID=144197 RepID=A0A3B4Z8G1_9TELE|nr:PREDICTED: tumor necrosis factor receptor superfamily member 5-like [Stegastes partitus]
MRCSSEDKYPSGRRCCDRCAAGTYVKSDCDGSKPTECSECGRGYFTATRNHSTKCYLCRSCSATNNQRTAKDCSSTQNTVCDCVSGFYCSNAECEHCQPATQCPPGEGVRVPATRTNNTICSPCEDGTFSNVTDFHSACKPHTSCEDYGRVPRIPGTSKTDAVCGGFKSHCPWMLPAGLWSGLVLTLLVLILLLVWWRSKRGSYRAVTSTAPAPVVPAPDVTLGEFSSHCQETCTSDACKISIFTPHDEDEAAGSVQDSIPITPITPITPFKASVSFAESSQVSGSAGYCTGNFLRLPSEPQEDEYCGT